MYEEDNNSDCPPPPILVFHRLKEKATLDRQTIYNIFIYIYIYIYIYHTGFISKLFIFYHGGSH